MKKIHLIILVLILSTLACSVSELLPSGSDNGNSSLPTAFPTPVPTLPSVPMVPTDTMAPDGDIGEEPTSAVATETALGDLTPTVMGAATTTNFYTCTTACIYNGSNHQSLFSEKTKIIYFTFDYENFPSGASYSRVWTRNGVEWARYQCSWYGPSSGVEQITLTEPGGLASGTWEVKISVDGEIVLQESLEVDGGWTYWDPAGFFSSCYGKR